MAKKKELVTFQGDADFRKGACHGADWFLQTIRMLCSEGRNPEEICDHLLELAGVLEDWRAGNRHLPDGNPWDWSFKDLASVIKARKRR